MIFSRQVVNSILDSHFIIDTNLSQVTRFKRTEDIDLASVLSLVMMMLSQHENTSMSLHSLRTVLERSFKTKTRLMLWWRFCVTKKKLALLNLIYLSLHHYFKESNDVRFLGALIKLNEIFWIPYNVMLIVRFFGVSIINVKKFTDLYRIVYANSSHFTK
jgi:hypothetical protein